MHSTASRTRRLARLAATAALAGAALAPAAHASTTWVGAPSASLDGVGTSYTTDCYRCIVLPRGADGAYYAASARSVVTQMEVSGFTGKVVPVALQRNGENWRIVRSGDPVAAPAGRATIDTRLPVVAGDVLGVAVLDGTVGLVDDGQTKGFDRIGDPTGVFVSYSYVSGTSIPPLNGTSVPTVKARFSLTSDVDGDGFADLAPYTVQPRPTDPTGMYRVNVVGAKRVAATQHFARQITVPLTCMAVNKVSCNGVYTVSTAFYYKGHYYAGKALGSSTVGPKAGATQTTSLVESSATKATWDKVFAGGPRRLVLTFTSSRPGGGDGQVVFTIS